MSPTPIDEPVTVVIPALDEEDSIGALIEALLSGTRVPDEIVVGDGGSTDRTRSIAASYERVRVVDGLGGISENRNAAIAAASHDVIACTDAGCVPEPRWLEAITAPFRDGAQWVGGLSRPARSTPLQAVIGLAMMPSPSEIDLTSFVPGGASQAFRRSTWSRVGGFPEGMRAGEDTLFGQRLRTAGVDPVIVTDAMVVWQAPSSPTEMLGKARAWGRADGEAGTGSRNYAKLLGFWVGLPTAGAGLLAAGSRLVGSGLLGSVAAAAVWKTRKKHRALADPVGSMLLPPAYAARVAAQSIGWLRGFLARSDRPRLGSVTRTQTALGVAAVKRRVRPFVPDRVMSRLRTATTDHARNNIDVLVASADEVDPWLDATPSTYRVGVESVGSDRIEDPAMVVVPDGVDAELRTRLTTATSEDRPAAVAAITRPPRIDRGRINEPTIDPVAVAVRADALPVEIPPDPSTLQHVIAQSGVRQALLPLAGLDSKPSIRPIGRPGSALILGTVPLYDVGGGSRGAQMAHELVARGYHVTYLHLFESDEAVDLGLRYVHPQLDVVAADRFDPDRLVDRLGDGHRIAIVELPHHRYVEPIARLRRAGYRIVYDLMDDWSDQALGGWGYRESIERDLAVGADGLVASAASLVQRLERLSGRPVSLVPNAVNTRLFVPGDRPRPDDLPEGDAPVFEYHGSLYGDWFDWQALERVAETHPGARVVVIGDDRNHPAMPENVHFLGLKAQHLLPAYLAHSDVAIIPFEISETTHAVSPLKVFEYLAMGVPVASVPLEPVVGLAGVSTHEDLAVAVDMALAGGRPDPGAIAAEHGWGPRMEAIFESAGLVLDEDPDARPITVLQSPVVRWRPEERRLTP